jgi:uncharacterized protein
MHLREFILRRLPDKERLRQSFLFRVFGKHILAKDLWYLDARAVAGGVSLGLFIAFTPTIPFQMTLACLGALYFRVNLPSALLACWVTNPLTAIPIYVTAWRIGQWIAHLVPFLDEYLTVYADGRRARMVISSFHLWAGSLLLATAAASVSNVLLKWLWKETQVVRRATSRRTHRDR